MVIIMYHMLVMDDEVYIVNYLSEVLQKSFEEELTIYKACTSEEAFGLIKNTNFDFALLDMSMPVYNGLEMADKILEVWKNCRIIFLTAMDKFDYIYQADKIPKSKYLLKTESDETIIRTIGECIEEQNKELQLYHNLDMSIEKNQYLNHLVVQNILQNILYGQNMKMVRNKIMELKIEFPFQIEEKIYLVNIYILNDFYNQMMRNHHVVITTYYKIMNDLLQQHYTCLLYDDGKDGLFWLLQSKNENNNIDILKSILDKFIQTVDVILNQKISIEMSKDAVGFVEIKNQYELLKSYKSNFLKNTANDTTIRFVENNQDIQDLEQMMNVKKIDTDIKAMERALNTNQWKEFEKILNHIEKKYAGIESIHDLKGIQCYMKIAVIIMEYMECHNLEYDISMKVGTYGLYYLNDYQNWQEAFAFLRTISSYIFILMSEKSTDKNNLLIGKIKNYIEKNVKTHLTLAQIGNHVNYNESYISRVFKQETGKGLFEYINLVRVDLSKTLLLNTDYTIQEIAWEVGFDTPQYFSGVFKKIVGITPGNYRLQKDN
ncbi:MAG: helix-turn-helix domain-containing protein [Eubacteriales bacterium]